MSRLPIRLRLTAAFALAMLAVLVAAGLFAYVVVRAELNESVTASLEARAAAVAAVGRLDPGAEILEPDESLTQLLSPSGRLLAAAGGGDRPVLTRDEAARAASGTLVLDREVDGIEGGARLLARPSAGSAPTRIAVAGQSLEDRDETLAGLLAAFAIGGPVAVVLASLLGYLLASAGLAPVEAMRRRAGEISLERDETLPLPAADDEIHRLGATLNEMLGRLRGSFERERRFVADASHELRTPVTVLKAEIEAALRAGEHRAEERPGGEHRAEVRESLRAALDECDHLAQLADDLLVLARAGEHGLPVRREELRVSRLLEDVRDRFGYRAQQHGRAISIDAPPDLTVSADPLRMRQALGNLVDNALRHGEGEIALTARTDSDGRVELTVSDHGSGFAPELAERAFDRFSRGDAARTRGGAGLGLAIVRSIARAHGGDAEILPSGAGAVRIRLPRSGSGG